MEILIRDKKKRCDNIIYMFGKIEITSLTILANLSFHHSSHVDIVDDKNRWWKGKYCPSHCCGPALTAGLVFHQCWLWESSHFYRAVLMIFLSVAQSDAEAFPYIATEGTNVLLK